MLPTPSRAIEQFGPGFYDVVAPARFPEHRLRFRNDRAAAEIGLDRSSDSEWIDRMARFVPIPGSLEAPLALRYHGHQFRNYNPEIGDGRGFLYAQFRAIDGRLLDLGTKGSGTTPWSRFGDGRLTLKGAVREALATEMLEALGVPTSRTLSIVETGEALTRGDEPSPTRSAVLVRLSHGHIRIGTFQRLAHLGETDNLARLVDYVRRELHGAHDADPVALLAHTVAATARTVARIMVAGFVHGVLNTDNINVTGESFDYGPWRFLPALDPAFTAAYFDHGGLYAYGRQPEAIQWNLLQLARALRPLAEAEPLLAALQSFPAHYAAELGAATLARLGIAPRSAAEDEALFEPIARALTETQAPFDQFWWDWRGGYAQSESYPGPQWTELADTLAPYRDERAKAASSDPDPPTMLIDEVERIWTAIADHDDWDPFTAKITAVRRFGAILNPPGSAPGR